MRTAPHNSLCPLAQHLLCLLPLVLMVCLLYAALGGENAIAAFFQSHRASHPILKKIVAFFSAYGIAPFYCAYALIGWQAYRSADKSSLKFVAAAAITLLVAVVATNILKLSISRPRPPESWDHFGFFSSNPEHRSFPSGHMTEGLSTIVPLAQRYGRFAFPLFSGGYLAAVGFARVYLGRHWPTDLLGSAIVSSTGIFLCWRLAKAYDES